MLELLGIAWSAWKLSAKRFGPVGGVLFAGVAVVGFVFLRDYLKKHHPKLGNAVEKAA